MNTRWAVVGLWLVCASLVAAPASAQVYTGRIDVTIKDGTGSVLPGVTVEAVGTQTDVAVTDANGEAHFVNLAPGRYAVTAKLTGFTDYRNENVPVNAGSIIPLGVTMSVGGLTERVDVTSETPVIETKKQTVSTNVNLDELQNIPTARDPWVVLQTVPGIVVDRVNVGGAESGQQSNYQAKGANPDQNTWNMDGIAITDMGSLGASPTYYDFDMFQEMQVTTGGADPANATPGVQLNFVLRSGTSKWRGTTRYYFENDSLQSDNVSSELFGQIASYNRVGQYKDWGFEGGGPIIKNRLFAWGAYGKTEPVLNVFSYDSSYRRLHADRPRCDDAREHLDEDHRRHLVEVARQLHLLPRQQVEVRPRRLRLPSRRDDLQPGRPDRSLQVRVQPDDRHEPVRRRPLRAHEEWILARAARRTGRAVIPG